MGANITSNPSPRGSNPGDAARRWTAILQDANVDRKKNMAEPAIPCQPALLPAKKKDDGLACPASRRWGHRICECLSGPGSGPTVRLVVSRSPFSLLAPTWTVRFRSLTMTLSAGRGHPAGSAVDPSRLISTHGQSASSVGSRPCLPPGRLQLHPPVRCQPPMQRQAHLPGSSPQRVLPACSHLDVEESTLITPTLSAESIRRIRNGIIQGSRSIQGVVSWGSWTFLIRAHARRLKG